MDSHVHLLLSASPSGLTKFSFLCPAGSLFQQQTEVCDWWHNVNCSNTESYYGSKAREGKHHNQDVETNPDSCLVLMGMDPLGQQGGSEQATGCERQLGIYDGAGLENVPTPYSYKLEGIGAVNTCEEHCLKKAECEYYEFDCKLSLCTLKMGNAAGSLINSRYITGKKSDRAPKECQEEITTRFPPREPGPGTGTGTGTGTRTETGTGTAPVTGTGTSFSPQV